MAKLFYEVGESYEFEMSVAITGVASINTYSDETTETPTEYFKKEFSINLGVSWSDYELLNDTNLQAVQVLPELDVLVRFRYTREGNDNGVPLELCFCNIEASYIEQSCKPEFESSVFNELLDCGNTVSRWCVNVLGKVYNRGIIPNYIKRNDGIDDRDYIDFWRSIICFFAIIVEYARSFTFERFYENKRLLRKFLESRRIPSADSTTYSMQQTLTNRLNTIAQNGSEIGLNRIQPLAGYTNEDEFLVYKTDNSLVLAKKKLDGNLKSIPDQILNGVIDTLFGSAVDAIKVNPKNTYVVRFSARVNDITSTLKIEGRAWDSYGNYIGTESIDPSTYGNLALDNITFPRPNEWFTVEVVFYGYNEPFNSSKIKTSLNIGDNQKMFAITQKVFPKITTVGDVEIKDYYFGLIADTSIVLNTQTVNINIKNRLHKDLNYINEIIPYGLGIKINEYE